MKVEKEKKYVLKKLEGVSSGDYLLDFMYLIAHDLCSHKPFVVVKDSDEFGMVGVVFDDGLDFELHESWLEEAPELEIVCNSRTEDTLAVNKPSATSQASSTGGLRYNEGKLRYDLIPPVAQEALVAVLTYGANKYTVRDEAGNIISKGDNNWRKGMGWRSIIASAKRHIAEIEKGNDFDEESGILHAAHAMTNLAFLTEFYAIFPQGDDRNQSYLTTPKVGLDIDEVICDWVRPWCDRHNLELPSNWLFSYDNVYRFEDLAKEGLDDFYANLPAKVKSLNFEPHCYITSRSVDKSVTEKWLEDNGFPTAPVYSVGFGKSKVEVALESGVDIFIDDCYQNFVELNRAGICTYLYSAPHNMKHDVGHKRINSLDELPFFN